MASEGGVMDLDRLIQTCEFENKQYVKLIEKENQQTEALEREIEEKQRGCLKLEEALSQLDEDTKRAHKQFTLNRDNCDSLRKTMVVLMEHEVALHRKLNCLIANGEDERQQHEGVVKHYKGIYLDYMAKYKTFPLVKDLLIYEEEVATKEKLLQEVQEKIDDLKKQIDVAQGSSEVNFKDLNKFVIKLADMKVDTNRAVAEKTQFETELQEIQSKNTRQEQEAQVDDGQWQFCDVQNTAYADDSFGDEISTMIGIYHNKSDEAELNTNNSGDILQPIANLSIKAPVSNRSQLKCVEDQSEKEVIDGGAMDIPADKMTDTNTNPVQSSPSNMNRPPPPSPTVVMNTTTAPSMFGTVPQSSAVLNRASDSSQVMDVIPPVSPIIMNKAPVLPKVPPASPVINTAPVRVLAQIQSRTPPLVPMGGSQPRTTFTPVSSNQSQPGISTTSPQITFNQPRSLTPKPVDPSQVHITPKLTPKIKHGVCSIQSKPAELISPVRYTRPSLLIPSQEQRNQSVCTPRLQMPASPQIRAPPQLAIPPPPPKTPDTYRRQGSADVPRFVSPVRQPHTRHQTPVASISVVPQQLYATSVTSSHSKYLSPTTPETSTHFNRPFPGQTSSNQNVQNISSEDVVMESPERSKSRPTTPGRVPEENPRSPFDLEKHLQQINILSKSPGAPMYTQRPMFETVESNVGDKSPGPFVQSFSVKTSNTARSEPGQLTSNTGMNAISFHQPREMNNFFGGQQSPETPQMAETSFLFGGSNKTPTPDGSFLSMFGSNEFQTPTSAKTPQSNFSFSFGQGDTPKSTGEAFSFSFGGSGDDDRSPSMFNLF